MPPPGSATLDNSCLSPRFQHEHQQKVIKLFILMVIVASIRLGQEAEAGLEPRSIGGRVRGWSSLASGCH
ncbi:hypothetical protein PTTG_25319 [Puccinia triticina 1-1 BBBD Race 1]|uniref:Uncharacterized protein n=1 Tax=Puccinia triticina (isolate 1-1 / race 1 (BBBD)) TaxID=630390 RepID=A0A180H4D8_PUCT1|nr:hypothetical protein PTTG_25319 [Puccinia triticina 1-1 BBBD Race 1]